ncbi:glycosyltransferase [Planctomycetota bacterium]
MLVMSEIVNHVPEALFIVLGATHPNQVHRHQETYRHRLEQLVSDLGMERHVVFQDLFVSQEQLCDYMAAADVYVMPYACAEQVTSGTLSYALGTGCAIVSTPYWYAQELLGDGCGILLPSFADASILADILVSLLNDPVKKKRLQRKAYNKGRKMIWPVAGQAYSNLFDEVKGGWPSPVLSQPPAWIERDTGLVSFAL